MQPPTLILATLLAVLALAPAPARASAVMYPTDFGSEPTGDALPTRLIRADAEVRSGLAVVRNEYRFDNTAFEQIEGLLRTRVPRNAVVTDFAYYYKGIRVPGRILENEEAERIYRAITGAGRDPALLRRKDDGTYEARLFPIEPRSEIRVELEYRYAVPEYGGRLKFLYPLTAGKTGTPVDRVSVRVKFTGDPITGATASPGTASVSSGAATAAFEAEKWQPKQDFGASVVLRKDAPRSQVLLEPGGSREGIVALRLRGVGVNGAVGAARQAVLARAGAGNLYPLRHTDGSHSRYWFARAGRPVASSQVAATGAVSTRPEADLAGLWAKAYTDQLSAQLRRTHRRATRDLIVRISKRYRVDTELTSYLAVPDSEWAAYQDRLDQERRTAVDRYIWEARGLRYVVQLPVWVVPGDPVIRIPHRPELLRASAILPDGDILSLYLDPVRGVWECRFDIPEGAAEGEYRVTVVVHERATQGGEKRSELSLTYRVDLTRPAGQVQGLETGSVLVVGADEDVARVVVFFPDGSRTELARLTSRAPYRGELKLAPGRYPLRIRLYDRVHNWIELEEEIDVR